VKRPHPGGRGLNAYDQARWDAYRWGERTPEDCNFAAFAAAFAATLGAEGIRTDFTPASVAALDLWLLGNLGGAPLAPARQEDAGLLVAGIAAYLGEVLCRCLDARYEPDPTAPSRPRLLLPGGGRLCPSAEVERRFVLGQTGGLYPRLVALRHDLRQQGLLLRLPDPALDWLAQAEALALAPGGDPVRAAGGAGRRRRRPGAPGADQGLPRGLGHPGLSAYPSSA
jgi:hypothetical protein